MKRMVLIGTALLVVGAIAPFLWRFIAIDRCLDDGGAWSKTANRCECSREQLAKPDVSKEYVAFCERPGTVP